MNRLHAVNLKRIAILTTGGFIAVMVLVTVWWVLSPPKQWCIQYHWNGTTETRYGTDCVEPE